MRYRVDRSNGEEVEIMAENFSTTQCEGTLLQVTFVNGATVVAAFSDVKAVRAVEVDD